MSIRLAAKPVVFLFLLANFLFFTSCKKTSSDLDPIAPARHDTAFVTYTIPAGEHYSDKNIFKSLELKTLKFVVRFDSSAIYKTAIASNQPDINKLYGFSEGYDHLQNSARIGWAWVNHSLRLYAYAYNAGKREYAEITRISIGSDINCSISLSANKYVFRVNGIERTLARSGSGESINGYQLYPYFGGDETAPHDINISIAEIKN